jgi:lysophospholipase L1-like esterase
VQITFDLSAISVPENAFSPKDRPIGWGPFAKTITQIINEAREQGAVPFVVLYPGVAARLAPYANLSTSIATTFENYVNTESKRVSKIVKNAGGRFINVTNTFRQHSKTTDFTQSSLNLHLNQAGVDLLYEAILPELGPELDKDVIQ